MHYYPFNIGDYSSHTRHLTQTEDLVYRRLLDLYYLHEQPLNGCLTTVARLINMRENSLEIESVLREFFEYVEDKGWVNSRADVEILKYHEKKEQASKAGKASAIKRRSTAVQRTFNAGSTDVQPNKKQETRNKKQETPEGFDVFWSAYPKKVAKGNAESAFKKANINGSLSLLLSALDKQKQSDQWKKDNGQFIPNPATWLNQRRWEDETSSNDIFNGDLAYVMRKPD